MKTVDYIVIALVIAACIILPLAAERGERDRIVNSCRNLGSFEAAGVVFKCKERVPKL